MSRPASTRAQSADLLTDLLALQVERQHFDPAEYAVTTRRPAQRERGPRPPRPPANCDRQTWRDYRLAEFAWRNGR